MDLLDKILTLTKQLYPTGRAFKMPFDGYLQKLHAGLNISEAQAYIDAISILDALLPDNANFTTDDAEDWERRLGLITGVGVSLSVRKMAIIRKMNAPGINPAKGNYLYIQQQLQAAGFDVYVYKNKFSDGSGGYITKTPFEVSGNLSLLDDNQFGQFQFGQRNFGGISNNKVVNSLINSKDTAFNTGSNLRSTFFIGGNPLGSVIDVTLSREKEFRALILLLKPVQTVAFLFINYT